MKKLKRSKFTVHEADIIILAACSMFVLIIPVTVFALWLGAQ